MWIFKSNSLHRETNPHTSQAQWRSPQATDSKRKVCLRNNPPGLLRKWSIFLLMMSCKRNPVSNRASFLLLLYKKWAHSLQTNGKFWTNFLILLEMKVLLVFRAKNCCTLCPLSRTISTVKVRENELLHIFKGSGVIFKLNDSRILKRAK